MEATRKAALTVGDAAYFTGKMCKHGHISARRTKTGECLECRAAFLVRWREQNPDKVKLHNSTQYACHAENLMERSRMYHAANPEKVSARAKQYQLKNLHRFAAINAKREAAKIQRTPVWLDKDDFWMMEQAYELAALRTKMLGYAWHVDHIIPLQGKIVSGLHVPTNLQVISAKENLRKSNRFSVNFCV